MIKEHFVLHENIDFISRLHMSWASWDNSPGWDKYQLATFVFLWEIFMIMRTAPRFHLIAQDAMNGISPITGLTHFSYEHEMIFFIIIQ